MVAGVPAAGTGFAARLGGVARGLGGGDLDERVVVEMDEVVVVVEVVESEAQEMDVAGGGGSWVESEVEEMKLGYGRGCQMAGAGVGCWVLLGRPWLVWVAACARLVLSDMVVLSCRAAWAGFILWVHCYVVCLLAVPRCGCGVLGHLAPVHRCARSVCCVACAVSLATWALFTCVQARCDVLRVLRPGLLGSCSPVCTLGVLCCVCGVLGHSAPVHLCACSMLRFGIGFTN